MIEFALIGMLLQPRTLIDRDRDLVPVTQTVGLSLSGAAILGTAGYRVIRTSQHNRKVHREALEWQQQYLHGFINNDGDDPAWMSTMWLTPHGTIK